MATESATVKRPAWSTPAWLRGLLAFGLVVGMLALLVLGLVRTSSSLVVEVDGHRYKVRTHARTVGAALQQAGFDLHPEDLVSPGLEVRLLADATDRGRIALASPGQSGGATVVQVHQARPVTLRADGQIHQFRTQATTLREFLSEVGVAIGPADEIWLDDRLVDLSMPLSAGVPLPSQSSQHRGGGDTMQGDAEDPPIITLRRAASLTLDDDGVTTTLHTTRATVGQALQEQGVTLFLGDEVTPGLQDRISTGMTVSIHRSVPVEIDVDGSLILTRTRAETVAGVLGQEGIALVGKDRAEPDLAEPVRTGLTIRITRVREEYVVEFDPIPFETVQAPDSEVEIDNVRLAQEGQVGLTKHRYRVAYQNDQEVDRFLEDTWTEQPPITKTIAYGTKIIVRTLDTPEGPIEYWRKMRVYTTSYTAASCGKPKTHPRYGYTRLGWWLTKGIVAVDPTVIPLRTKMYIPGYGIGRAGDTGGGVKGKFVDLGFDAHNYESWHWWTDIYLLAPAPPPDKIRWILPNLPRFPDRKRH